MEQQPQQESNERGRRHTGARDRVDQFRDKVLRRDGVISVRVDQESLEFIDALVEASVVRSRSEAAHRLIRAGIEARSELRSRLAAEKEETLRRNQELHQML